MSEIESKIQEKKIACIGCGVMGGSLVKAMTKVVSAANITVTAANYTEAVDFATAVGVKAAYGNAEAVKDADFVFLAVKPAYIGGVLGEIKDALQDFKRDKGRRGGGERAFERGGARGRGRRKADGRRYGGVGVRSCVCVFVYRGVGGRGGAFRSSAKECVCVCRSNAQGRGGDVLGRWAEH